MTLQHLGIYSGTFDPVHAGHLAFADEAQRVGRLDYVVFLPEAEPRGKTRVTPQSERIALLQQLTAPQHTVYQAAHPRFTVGETLPELVLQYPRATFSFLMGSDVVPSLPAWPDVEQLLRYQLIIGMRAGDRMEDVASTLDQLQASYTIVTTPHAHMSSRQLRLQK